MPKIHLRDRYYFKVQLICKWRNKNPRAAKTHLEPTVSNS